MAAPAPEVYSYHLCSECRKWQTSRCSFKDVLPNARVCPAVDYIVQPDDLPGWVVRRPNPYGPSLCIMNICACTKEDHEVAIKAWRVPPTRLPSKGHPLTG